MKYKIYKMNFKTSVHFGGKSLNDCNYTIMADTLFSALCQEALSLDYEFELKRLHDFVKNNKLKFSDLMPFVGDRIYIPKPYCQVSSDNKGDSSEKKIFKKMKYLPLDELDNFLAGNCDGKKINKEFSGLGKSFIRTNAVINHSDETKPYNVGTYTFGKGNGLYFIVGYENDEVLMFVDKLIESLSHQGIGGRLSSGMGRFTYTCGENNLLTDKLDSQSNGYITLSISLPVDSELENSISGSNYLLVKRSGFVSSEKYSKKPLKKKDFYAFSAGSYFTNKFDGDVYDVSQNGSHPVYRYAKPLFLGVQL